MQLSTKQCAESSRQRHITSACLRQQLVLFFLKKFLGWRTPKTTRTLKSIHQPLNIMLRIAFYNSISYSTFKLGVNYYIK